MRTGWVQVKSSFYDELLEDRNVMLEALEAVNRFAAKFDGTGHRSPEEERVLDQVYSAIQKARGL